MRVLWLIAAIMQLAAVTLYYTIGLGLGFVIVQLFVVVTCALAIFEVIRAKS
jgi:hypothetical protein